MREVPTPRIPTPAQSFPNLNVALPLKVRVEATTCVHLAPVVVPPANVTFWFGR